MLEWFGDYNTWSLLFLGDWGPFALVVLSFLGVVVVAFSAFDLRDMRPSRRWTLVLLRAAVYGLAVFLLLEPAVELKHVTKVKNKIAVLLDTSRSQSLSVDDSTTRLKRAQNALNKDLNRLLTEPNEDHTFEFFTVGAETTPTPYGELVDPALNATQDETKLLEAIEEATSTIGRRDLGGFMVFSDGIDSGLLGGRVRPGQPLDQETKMYLERLGVPIHTYATATPDGLRDLAISNVRYDDFAFVRNTISIDVVIQALGFEPTRIPVTLKRDGRILQTREVEIGPDKREYSVEFKFVPQQIGKEIYSVSLPTFRGEALSENNRKDFVLKVIRDKIRALHVVGQPSWDERFLRQLLKTNPNVDLVSFFILRTNENAQTAPSNELSLIPFPTRELFDQELGSFDVVFLQNFNYKPYNMTRYLPRIAEYVREGGGFAMIGGPLSFASGGYANTPIEDIIPVQLPTSSRPESVLSTQPFQPQLTPAGDRHPITQLAFDPAQNKTLWSKLPPLEGSNVVLAAKPKATVLATHQDLQAGGKPMPVIAVSEVGKGRSLAVTTDSTWHWSFRSVGQGETSRPYTMFWNSAIRWLIQDPELKLLQVKTEQLQALPNERVDLTIRVAQPDYSPAAHVEGTLEIFHRPLTDDPAAENTEELWKTEPFTTNSQGQVALHITPEKTGAYRVRAKAKTASGDLSDEDVFLIVLDSQELRTIEPRPTLLSDLSKLTQGSHNVLPDLEDTPRFKEPRVVQVNRRRVIDVWDSLYVLGLICLLLSVEWTLRRRWGRL